MTNRATLAMLVGLTVLVLLLRVMISTAASSGSGSGAAPAPAATVAGQSAAAPSGEGGAGAGAGAGAAPESPSPATAPHARFHSPSTGGMALDRCRSAATACGQPAADAYCQGKGYSRASRFRTHEFYPTRAIGDGFVCTRSFGRCDRFTEIWCAR